MKIPITSHSLVHSGSVVLVRESRSHQKTGRLYVDSAAEGEGTISTIAKMFPIMADVDDQHRDFGSAFDSDGNTSKRERREFFLAAQWLEQWSVRRFEMLKLVELPLKKQTKVCSLLLSMPVYC